MSGSTRRGGTTARAAGPCGAAGLAALAFAACAGGGAVPARGAPAAVEWPDGSRLQGEVEAVLPDGGPVMLRRAGADEPLALARGHGAAVRFTATEPAAAPPAARVILRNGDVWAGRAAGFTRDGLLFADEAADEPFALPWDAVRVFEPVHPDRLAPPIDLLGGAVLAGSAFPVAPSGAGLLRRGGPDGPVVTAADLLVVTPEGAVARDRTPLRYTELGQGGPVALDIEIEGGPGTVFRAHLVHLSDLGRQEMSAIWGEGKVSGRWNGPPGPVAADPDAPPPTPFHVPQAEGTVYWTLCADFDRGLFVWRRDGIEVHRMTGPSGAGAGEPGLVIYPPMAGHGRLRVLRVRPWRDPPGDEESGAPVPVLVRRAGAAPLAASRIAGDDDGLTVEPAGGGGGEQRVPWAEVAAVCFAGPPAADPAPAARVATRSGSRVTLDVASLDAARLRGRAAWGEAAFDPARLLAVAWPEAGSAGPEARLALRSGESLGGRPEAADGRAVRWSSPRLAAPASFGADGVAAIRFPTPARRRTPAGMALAVLRNGERVPGGVTGLADGLLTLATPFGGTARLPAEQLLRLEVRHPDAGLLLEGFGPPERWEQELPAPRRATFEGGALTLAALVDGLGGLGGVTREYIALPDRFRIELTASCPGVVPCFVLHAFPDYRVAAGRPMISDPAVGVRFCLTEEGPAIRTGGGVGTDASTNVTGPLPGDLAAAPVAVTVYVDRPGGSMALSVGGAPPVTAAMLPDQRWQGSRIALRALRRYPPVTLSDFRLSSWNGVLPRAGEAGEGGGLARIELVNGDTLAGRPEALSEGVLRLAAEEGGDPVPVPLDRVQRIVWSHAPAPAGAAPAGSWTVEAAWGARFLPAAARLGPGGAALFEHPALGPAVVPAEALTAVRFPAGGD